MSSDAEKKRLEAKHQQILQELLKLPENRVCADCPEKGPRWASWNIGCFLCLRCGGIHRRMGTHISRVKSVTLDSWTPEQIESIRSKGNAHVNSIYDPHPESHRHVNYADDQQLEQFIRDKYERKLFMSGSARLTSSAPSHDSRSRNWDEPRSSYGQSYTAEVNKLRDMGFIDLELNKEALIKSDGDVNKAVSYILTRTKSQSSPRAPASAPAPAATVSSLAPPPSASSNAKPANAPAPAQPQQNLLDFDAPTPQPTQQAPKATQATDGFADFVSASQKSAAEDIFGDFAAPGGSTGGPAAKATKDDILSLFSAAPAAQPSFPAQGGFPPQQGMFPPPQAGYPAQAGFPAQPPPAAGGFLPQGMYGQPAAQGMYGQPQAGMYGQPGMFPGAAPQQAMYGQPGAFPGAYPPQQAMGYGAPQAYGAYGMQGGFAQPASTAGYGQPAPNMGYGQPAANPFGAAPVQGVAAGYNPFAPSQQQAQPPAEQAPKKTPKFTNWD